MSIWRSIVDGAQDFVERHRQANFTMAIIGLAAKMAKSDGAVTPQEVHAFRDIFHVPADEEHHVMRLFDQARRDVAGFEHYANKAARMFHDEPAVLEHLLDGLFHVAKSDRVADPREIDFLRKVAAIFGFDAATFERVRAGHLGRDDADPYVLLGIAHDAADEAVRTAWRRLVREHHPDLLVAQGMPAELVGLANARLAAINAAYETIRGLKRLKTAAK
jgi:DnaJ like chaperone protein